MSDAIEAVRIRRDRLGGHPAIGGRAGNGILFVGFSVPDDASDRQIVDGILGLREDCRRLGGSLVVEDCPRRFKESVDVWGDVGLSIGIMRKLKDALDPRGTLNPGRFVGGI
jgi:glycolate oxidase FAD binding subunit